MRASFRPGEPKQKESTSTENTKPPKVVQKKGKREVALKRAVRSRTCAVL